MGQHRLGLAPHLPRRCFNLYFTISLSWFSLQALTHLLLTKEDASFMELLDGLEVGLSLTPAVKQCYRSGERMTHSVLQISARIRLPSDFTGSGKALQSTILSIAGERS